MVCSQVWVLNVHPYADVVLPVYRADLSYPLRKVLKWNVERPYSSYQK